jgi:hypothetical protein
MTQLNQNQQHAAPQPRAACLYTHETLRVFGGPKSLGYRFHPIACPEARPNDRFLVLERAAFEPRPCETNSRDDLPEAPRHRVT